MLTNFSHLKVTINNFVIVAMESKILKVICWQECLLHTISVEKINVDSSIV